MVSQVFWGSLGRRGMERRGKGKGMKDEREGRDGGKESGRD